MSKTAFGMKLTNTSFKCVCIRKKYQEIRFRSRERGDEKKKVKCTAYIYQFTTRNVIIIYWKHTGKRIIIKANLPTSWKAVQIFLSAHTNIWHIYIYMRKHIHTRTYDSHICIHMDACSHTCLCLECACVYAFTFLKFRTDWNLILETPRNFLHPWTPVLVIFYI